MFKEGKQKSSGCPLFGNLRKNLVILLVPVAASASCHFGRRLLMGTQFVCVLENLLKKNI